MTAPSERDTLRDQFDLDVDVGEREIRVFGDVTPRTASLLITAATSILVAAPGDLTLDLAGVKFADAALLNAIDDVLAATYHLDEYLLILNPSAAVKRLFLAAGASELLRDTLSCASDSGGAHRHRQTALWRRRH